MIPSIHYLGNVLAHKQSLSFSQNSILKPIIIVSLSILGSLIMLCALLVKPLFHPEYIRWFVHNYYALLSSSFIIYMCDILLKLNNKKGKLAVIVLFTAVPALHLYYTKDFQRIYSMVNFQKVSLNQMKEAQDALTILSKDGPCYLITESHQARGMGWDLTMQNYKPLDYFYVISNCTILNGSWITLPFENSRDLLGLPSSSFFSSTNFEPIYYIGKQETLELYLPKLDHISTKKMNVRLGENWVYKLIRDAPNSHL